MQNKFKRLKGVCIGCLGCNKLELEDFEGMYSCPEFVSCRGEENVKEK